MVSEGEYVELADGPLGGLCKVEFQAQAVDSEQIYIFVHRYGTHIGSFSLSPVDAKLLAKELKAEVKVAKQSA